MTIDEIRKAKEDAEQAILIILKILEESTGVGMQDVNVIRLLKSDIGMQSRIIVTGVKLKMEL